MVARSTYCNPLNSQQRVKYGQIAYGVSGNNSGDNYAIAQDDNGVYEFTKALTPSAIGLMSIVSTDTAEILVADDRVSGWTSDAINPNAIVVNTGTTTVIGAFTVSGAKMNAQTTSIPSQSTTALRSYAASTGKLYSLEPIRGWKLLIRDVPTMLAGQASVIQKVVTGALPLNALAVAWDTATSRLMVLDWMTNAERLLAIDANGASTEVWRTSSFTDQPHR